MASLWEGFRENAFSKERELVLHRTFQDDGEAFGLEHWVVERGLNFSQDFVGFLNAIGTDQLAQTTKWQLKCWVLDVFRAVANGLDAANMTLSRSESLVSSSGRPWLHLFLESVDWLVALLEPGAARVGKMLVDYMASKADNPVEAVAIREAIQLLEEQTPPPDQPLSNPKPWRPLGRTLRD